jgi:putative ATP-dependent endonuclease of the OLD family
MDSCDLVFQLRGGASRIKPVCPQLIALGYQTAVLCDNDAPAHLSADDIQNLRTTGVHVCHWDNGNSTERQLFNDLPWQHISTLLTKISENHDTLELGTIVDRITQDPRVARQNLGTDPTTWPESQMLRHVMGDSAHNGGWIKRVDYASKVFEFALPLLPDGSILKSRLNALWNWIQNE